MPRREASGGKAGAPEERTPGPDKDRIEGRRRHAERETRLPAAGEKAADLHANSSTLLASSDAAGEVPGPGRRRRTDRQTQGTRRETRKESGSQGARPPARRPRSQMLGSLFGKTEARAHIPMEKKLFYFFVFIFYGEEGRGIFSPDAITPRK